MPVLRDVSHELGIKLPDEFLMRMLSQATTTAAAAATMPSITLEDFEHVMTFTYLY
jgi:hypothetical protein